MTFYNLSRCRDFGYLREHLCDDALQEIEDILSAYNSGDITIDPPSYEDGILDFFGEWELEIPSGSSYKEKGGEITIIRWYEDWGEDTGYIVELFEDYNKD